MANGDSTEPATEALPGARVLPSVAVRPRPPAAVARVGERLKGGRIRAALKAIPRPLLALLPIVALFGVTWALINPAWQSPDEDVHFSYVQTLSELHRLPGAKAGPSLSSAQVDAMQSFNNDPIVFFPYARPEWTKWGYEQWKQRSKHDSQADAGGGNAASTYPPLYYLWASLGYRIAGHTDVITHLYAARLISVVWLLVTTIGVWLLAGEIFGRRRLLQLVAAASVGLWPMVDLLSASINPDSLLYALWTFALWLGVAIIKRGLTPARGAAFGACVGLALVTKATSLALVPPAVFVFAVGLWRMRRAGLRPLASGAAAALALFFAPVLAWHFYIAAQHRPSYAQAASVTTGLPNIREFISYVWEYYLPRLPFQHPVHFDTQSISSYPALNVWVAGGWAAFGWVTVTFQRGVYRIFGVITLLLGVAAATKVWLVAWHHRHARVLRSTALPVAIFLVGGLLVLLLGLHWNEYKLRTPTNQGRYLFPLAGLAGLTVAGAVSLVPRRGRTIVAGCALGALLVYQLCCLGLVASHYYAS